MTYASVLVPIAIDSGMLASSTEAEDDYAAYNPATTYGITDSDRVISTTTHRIYQSLRASNINHDPDDVVNRAGDAPWWQDVSATNRWKMFDDQVATPTIADSPFTVVLTPGPFNAVDLRGLDADEITITVKDAPGGAVTYTYTGDLEGSEPGDYYEYYFDPFKPQTDFIATGIEPYQELFTDAGYSLPDKDWVLDKFTVALAASGFALTYGDYAPESCDCDDFAFFAYFMARVSNARANNKRGILFGVLIYEEDKTGQGHAINWFVSVKNGVRELCFYDPQQKMLVKLSKHEKNRVHTCIV